MAEDTAKLAVEKLASAIETRWKADDRERAEDRDDRKERQAELNDTFNKIFEKFDGLQCQSHMEKHKSTRTSLALMRWAIGLMSAAIVALMGWISTK